MKPVLDACCGGRMMWYDKSAPDVIYVDRRTVPPQKLSNRQNFTVRPTLLADFTALPFPDETFRLVVLDPPHMRAGQTSFTALKYGRLEAGWRDTLRRAVHECFRVLDASGTLVLKWNATHYPLADIISLAPYRPMFGTRSRAETHWIVFGKHPDSAVSGN